MTKNITIKDIALQVGVSHVTVSHALRNSPIVKEQTRQRIHEVAQELGYQPNFAARSLINRSTKALGIYVAPRPWSGLGNTYENRILRGIEQAAKQAQYDLMLINLTGDESGEVCVQKLAQRRVDGMMLISPEAQAPWVTELAKYTRNVVMIDPVCPNPHFKTVLFDNTLAVQLAVKHLHDLGHRRIGFLGSCLASPTQDSIFRQEAFVQVAQEMGLKLDPAWIFHGSDPAKPLDGEDHYCQIEGIRGARHMLQMPLDQRPTALLAYNDLVAVHAMRHLATQLSLPAQMSVVSIDDSDWCLLVEPHLTSVRHPLDQMGQVAVQWLVEHLIDKNITDKAENRVRLFKPELVVRKSATKLNGYEIKTIKGEKK